MKVNRLSFLALIIGLLVAIFMRFGYFTNNEKNGYNATTWDAFGYYAYLPATFIYKDTRKLEWVPKIDSTYHVTGGYFYQADTLKNGNLTFKYLGGVAVMQSPFFALGHTIAKFTDAPEDGFSWPYQYAIIWGAIFWFIFGLFFLRKTLLYYYSDHVVALTLILVVLGTNLLQYVSVDGAMSHVYIFPLYALLLYLTHHWHIKPKANTLFWIAFIIGLASISRPTELVMIFIPLLWKWQSELAPSKWRYLWNNKVLLGLIVFGFLLGISPQLAYWKYTTGGWIHNVGSKWFFLNPWWRVLFGFEKGWFIYTPLTLLFVIGFFFTKGRVFHKAIVTFGLINIWIIISWSDWRYGASYSVRALTQSYPVYSFAMAAVIHHLIQGKFKWLYVGVSSYFVALNLFQIWQYNRTILHFDHMNASYYKAIYWNADPTPLDFSLMDSARLKPSSWLPSFMLSYRTTDTTVQPWKTNFLHAPVDHPEMLHFRAKFNSTDVVFGSNWTIEEYKQQQLIHTYQLRLGQPYKDKIAKKEFEAYFNLNSTTDSVAISLSNFVPIRLRNLEISAEIKTKH